MLGFTINKILLEIHGSSIKEETIVALRRVKVFIIKSGNINIFVVGKDLLSSLGDASKRYKSFLAEQEKQATQEKEQAKKKSAVRCRSRN